MTKPLWKHQKETLGVLRKIPRVFDMSDPGTGKTRVHLEAFRERRRNGGGKGLIVCPKTLMDTAWLDDINEWTPDLSSVIAIAEDRKEMLDRARSNEIDLLIVNTDAVKALAKLPESYWRGFDTWIDDEHSAYKHRTSQRSKAALKLCRYFEHRAGLTGTPNPNSVVELWHQVLLLDDGKRLGTNFWKFQSATCVPKQIGPMPQHVRWEDREGIEAVVAEMLRDMTVRHLFEECMDIPAHTVRTVRYRPPAALMKHYKAMERDALLELDKGDVTAIHKAALRTKLLQIASGAVYGRDGQVHILDTGRNELIVDLIDEVDHGLIFFNWDHQCDGLAAELESRKMPYAIVTSKNSREVKTQFQDGKLRTLLLHPETGAHGLTLTRGRRAIFASPFDRADYFKQAKHRIYRGGQEHKTETLMVEAVGTIEGGVYARTQAKGARMDDLLSIIKESKQ